MTNWKDAYPRPQLARDKWLSLDGEWTFTIKKINESGVPSKPRTIKVPFCPESMLSGLNRITRQDETMLYGRRFSIPEEWKGMRIILHLGAVDQTAKVYVDRKLAGTHEGGYLPFSFDITELLDEGYDTHSVIVEARDSLDHKYPWGKQKYRNGGMWYTPVSGIWKSVWLEPVPEEHITSLVINTGLDWAEIKVNGVTGGTLELCGRSYELAEAEGEKEPCASVRIEIDEPELWTPENPYLYEFSITSGDDSIRSYFALRTLTIENMGGCNRLCLNGIPYFFNGVLDQGYWHDGIYTPSSPDKYAEDILAMKSLGYNTLRKHIKIEPEVFYYECDRLGMVVFQDMVNNSDYSFVADSVLPTIGARMKRAQKIDDKELHDDPESRMIFLESMEGTVKALYNHPSICYWTIFNEGWGQFEADAAYDRLKELDSTRFVDSTSGWFWQNKSDVDSYHVYFKKADLTPSSRPLVLSEFGGYACKLPGYYYGGRRDYGYRKCADRAALQKDLERLYKEEIKPLQARGLSAAISTQLSDVEDETNGLLTYDREIKKVDPFF